MLAAADSERSSAAACVHETLRGTDLSPPVGEAGALHVYVSDWRMDGLHEARERVDQS